MSERLFLFDTNIVLALVRGNELANHLDATFHLKALANRPLISIVTHGEIRVLAKRNGWGGAKMAVLQKALNNLVTIPIHFPRVIEAYVEIDVYSQQHPDGARNMGKNDIWIAACAVACDATLITTDQDFSHLAPDLLSVEVVPPDAGRKTEDKKDPS